MLLVPVWAALCGAGLGCVSAWICVKLYKAKVPVIAIVFIILTCSYAATIGSSIAQKADKTDFCAACGTAVATPCCGCCGESMGVEEESLAQDEMLTAATESGSSVLRRVKTVNDIFPEELLRNIDKEKTLK